jgi:ElaB/YqjD/DUF883 family membrane-anchored ribosome-binding protein
MDYINKEKLKQDLGDAAEQAKTKASEYQNMAKEKYANTKEKMRYKREKMKMYVRENPEKAMWIALGIGALLGSMLLGGAKRRKRFCGHCNR